MTPQHPQRCFDAIKQLAHDCQENMKTGSIDWDTISESFSQIEEWASAFHTPARNDSDVLQELKLSCQKMREGESHCEIHLHYTSWYDGYEAALKDFTEQLRQQQAGAA